MKKIFTLIAAAVVSCFGAMATNAMWNMGEFEGFSAVEAGETHELVDPNGNVLTCYAKVALEGNSKSLDGVSYTKRLKLGGKIEWNSDGTPKAKAISFDVDGACDIEFAVLSGKDGNERTVTLYESGSKTEVGSYTTDDGSTLTAQKISYTGEAATLVFGATDGMNFYYIKVTATGVGPQLPEPTISYMVNKDRTEAKVEIEPVEGATIYYTLDGSIPTAKSTEYTGPFTVTEDGVVVKAIYISEDKTVASDSPVASIVVMIWDRVETNYFVWDNSAGAEDYQPTGGTVEAVGSGMAVNAVYTLPAQEVSYNVLQVASKVKDAADAYILLTLTDNSIKEGDIISVTAFRSNADNTKASGLALIPQDGSDKTIIIGDGTAFIDLFDKALGTDPETYEAVYTGEPNTIEHVVTAAEGETEACAFKLVRSSSSTNLRITNLTFTRVEAIDPSTSAVSSLSVDNNVEPVYYNLQGIRVANPTSGNIYIKVTGNKATKIVK